MLEWIAISFSRDLPNPGIEPGSLHCRQMLYRLSHQGNPSIYSIYIYICSLKSAIFVNESFIISVLFFGGGADCTVLWVWENA